MDPLWFFIGLALGAALGFLAGPLVRGQRRGAAGAEAQADLAVLRAQLSERTEQVEALKREIEQAQREGRSLAEQIAALRATLDLEREQTKEKLALVEQAEARMREAFEKLSRDALVSNHRAFLELAKTTLEKYQSEARGDLEQRQRAVETLVAPIREQLARLHENVQALETKREGAYAGLREYLETLKGAQRELKAETANLVRALRTPHVRGRWGELTLRRVAELAGLVERCDFYEQETVETETGRLRPDMLVRLPSNRTVVVDAKVTLDAFLDALEAPTDEERQTKLREHARQFQTHLRALASKAYAEQFAEAPEFVVMFIPGESFLSAALEQMPTLWEEGFERGVVMATPATLFALLRAVAYGWRQEQLKQSAQAISALGKELHGRLSTLAQHFESLRRGLETSVDAFNRAVGSLESRVLVSARRFRDLGAATDEIPELSPVASTPRALSAAELNPKPDPIPPAEEQR